MQKYLSYLSISFLYFVVFGIFTCLFLSIFDVDTKWLLHLKTYFLFDSIFNTFKILFGVLSLSFLFGFLSSYLCSYYDFFGRKFFLTALFLSFCIPSYILAFIYLQNFGESSSIFLFLKSYFPTFSFRSSFGLILVLSLCFFPYIFLTSQIAFSYPTEHLKEASYFLNSSFLKRFFSLHFPLKFPLISLGLLFVCFETLSEFGASYLFHVETLTTLIYRTWFSWISLPTACLLSFLFLFFISIISFIFKPRSHRFKNEYGFERRFEERKLKRLSKGSSLLCFLFLSALFCLSFLFPVFHLIFYSFKEGLSSFMFSDLFVSFFLSFFGALLILIFSLFINYSLRNKEKILKSFLVFSSFCYGIPSVILAVGLINFLFLIKIWPSQFTFISILILLFSYLIRFLKVSLEILFQALKQIPKDLDDMSSFYHLSKFKKIYLPMMKKPILASFLFVFIEILKELPLTLFIRPLGLDSLPVRIFNYVSESQWDLACLPALFIVIISLLTLIILRKFFNHYELFRSSTSVL